MSNNNQPQADTRWGIHEGKLVTLHEYTTFQGVTYPKGVLFEHLAGKHKGKWTALLFDTNLNRYTNYAPKHALGVESANGVFKTQHHALLSFNKFLDEQNKINISHEDASPASRLIVQNYLQSLSRKGGLTVSETLSLKSKNR